MPVGLHYDKIVTDDDDTRPVAPPMTALKGLAICAVLVVIALQAMGLWLVARLQHSSLQRFMPPLSTSFHLEPAFNGIGDAPTVEKAWKIYDLPGYVQLEGQTYWPTVFHQLDYLSYLQDVYVRLYAGNSSSLPDTEPSYLREVESCIDYLRQGAMCGGDMSLEPQGGQATQAKRSEQKTVLHTCRNWEQIAKWQKTYAVDGVKA
ncbi:hypothetical protein MBLNU13_g08851t2 [Cladosporium sp. NU13]